LCNDILPLVEHATGELVWHIPEMPPSSVAGSDHGDDVGKNGGGLQDTTAIDKDFISNWSPLPPLQ